MTGAALILVHTAQSNVEVFSGLLAELAPEVPARHLLHQELLDESLAAGEFTPELRRRTAAAMHEAAGDAGLVLCTCSTIGPGADDAAAESSVPILRIDRPMAEKAVAMAQHIAVTATFQTTLGPTLELLEAAALAADREVELEPFVFNEARTAWAEGDLEGYLDAIARGLGLAAEEAELIVLAQASMAAALESCPDLGVPVLSSPRLGLEAALAAWRAVAGQER
jgi:hypothetical protein